MEKPPNLPKTDATDRATAPDDSSTSSVGPEIPRVVEPAPESTDDRSIEKKAQAENGMHGQPALDAAAKPETVPAPENGGRQNQPTPIIELLRGAQRGNIHVRRFHVTGDTIRAFGTEQTGFNYKLPLALHKSLLLPTKLKGCNSAREMFDSIRALVQHHGMLSDRQSRLVTYWSMACWFTDFLPFIPTLVITGPAFAADPLLRVLQYVCRRPVLLAGISPATLQAITANQVMPTLLIRAPQLSRAMAALLDASNQPGYFVSSGKDIWQFYGAKCIYLGEDGNQQMMGPRSIHVHTSRNAWEVGRSLPTNEVVQDLQNQMLFYRLIAHDRVASSNFRVTGFLPELCAMAEVLGAPILDDPELQKGIVELLKELNEQARVDRSSGLSAMVLRAVLWHCHQPDQQRVFVREIAATANQIYRDEGESLKISNETVGHMLKNLGLYTRRLGSAGRGLILDKATRSRAHKLGHANEALPDSSELSACGYCHELQAIQTAEVL